MNWRLDSNFFLFPLIIICFSTCQESNLEINQKFYERSADEWEEVLQDINIDDIRLSNTVLLIAYPTVCSSCIQEIKKWEKEKENISANIYFIVVERYNSRFKNFIKKNNFEIEAFQDKEAILTRNDYIPFMPVKLYFNEDEEVTDINVLGGDEDLESFMSRFN